MINEMEDVSNNIKINMLCLIFIKVDTKVTFMSTFMLTRVVWVG
ncbi:hypothetical protein B194_4610 [Serratia plymuthica A30]|uniref:Uncharacterized protein n=1 Tax=Serratia plymuthica S13 TaxID=1348660 RepID=S4YSV1_SERPL|nr:hypothetical protein M621_21995 [Serratia plymuthica S13]EKF62331.1 hypothetical protein B194_4610 [Serratia plymuthica A30]